MIIMNQFKDAIYDYRSCVEIYIAEEENSCAVHVITCVGGVEILGVYETKERASEVLKEITWHSQGY